MDIYGFDFTSAPSLRKPIWGVAGHLRAGTLQLDRALKIASLNEFEVFLKRRGPWIAGFDFPFGQPRKLIENLQWPQNWAEYVAQIATMSQQEFEAQLEQYRQPRPAGDKHHLRATDVRAKALSPMMLSGVPIGKMFFKGAPRLLRSGVSILPCRPTADDRIALEAYPALVARKWLGQRSYKSDDPGKQTAEQEVARRELLKALQREGLLQQYGFSLSLSPTLLNSSIEDPAGDSLDAVLCAIQAAWAATQADNYGLSAACDPLEGWIIDPELL